MGYKDSTHDKLMECYRKMGIKKTIEIARAMLETTTHKKDGYFLSHVHGEICETVLECLVLTYMEKYNLESKGWFYKKGLILKDVNNPKSGYFTELDLTVFTPQKIFAFECKSYGGGKKITDKCTIKKKRGGSFDVFDQHSKHFKVLADQLQPFRIINRGNTLSAPYQLILFDFATGETQDVRKPEDKVVMPCLNEHNVLNIFKIIEGKPVQWDIERVHKVMDIITKKGEENQKKHLSYVKNLHHDKK